jgi:hypothetical protein
VYAAFRESQQQQQQDELGSKSENDTSLALPPKAGAEGFRGCTFVFYRYAEMFVRVKLRGICTYTDKRNVETSYILISSNTLIRAF